MLGVSTGCCRRQSFLPWKGTKGGFQQEVTSRSEPDQQSRRVACEGVRLYP